MDACYIACFSVVFFNFGLQPCISFWKFINFTVYIGVHFLQLDPRYIEPNPFHVPSEASPIIFSGACSQVNQVGLAA